MEGSIAIWDFIIERTEWSKLTNIPFLPFSHRNPCWSALTGLLEEPKTPVFKQYFESNKPDLGLILWRKLKIISIQLNTEKNSSGSNVKNVVTSTTLTTPSAMTDQYWSTHQQLTKAQSIWQNEASVTISSLKIDGRGVCESKHRRSLCCWHELIVLRVLLASSESHWFRLSGVFTVCKWDHTDALWCGWMCFTLGPAVVMTERCREMC